MLPGAVQLAMLTWVQVFTVTGVIQPGLRFHRFAHGLVNLVHKRPKISSPAQGFGIHRIDGTRRTSNLIRQGVSLLLWERLRNHKYLACLLPRQFVHVEIAKALKERHARSLSSILYPLSSILYPLSSILYPRVL